MTLIGHLHPLLIHFPIALTLIAAAAEVLATALGGRHWRVAALVNVRLGAMFAVATVIVGWLLASSMVDLEGTRLLEWHRWLGIAAACVIVIAALTTLGLRSHEPRRMWLYRFALFSAAALVSVAGHVGAMLVWGANFLRP